MVFPLHVLREGKSKGEGGGKYEGVGRKAILETMTIKGWEGGSIKMKWREMMVREIEKESERGKNNSERKNEKERKTSRDTGKSR